MSSDLTLIRDVGISRGRRQANDELAALARAIASCRHGAAVPFDEAADDGQPDPQTSLRAVERLTLLHEQVENPRQHV